MQDLKILYLQSDIVWGNPAANRAHFSTLINNNIDKHDLVVLPETFTTGFPVDPAPFAETLDGETVNWMQQIAQTTGAVITGSFLLKQDNLFYNALLWITPNGEVKKYFKRHTFSMGGEDKKITRGINQLIVELKEWRIRPMICYDLRFPVWSKNRFDKPHGFEYDLAIYVANWPSQRSFPWETLLLTRAIENQAYVLGVNRVGYDNLGNYYSGNSKIVDPKGKIISEAKAGKETCNSVVISHESLTHLRNNFNVGIDWDIFDITE